jgi:DNA polymerase-3 subunit gamma/tau
MDSQVFYRRWRPQTLAEVVGQEHVTRTLLNALSSGHISHAYLFCGPRGTGKTSTGRILAKAVNCLENGSGEPCNICSMCQAITEGRALDVIEIDAASNRGIDEIRELRERVNYAPNEANYKVYIIDEVHMLTKEASNALLKTLEEPPPSVIFVLATTEFHKVLPTVLSRCQHFDFRRISQDDIILKLGHICSTEGIKIEPEALRLIARSATGSLRDAENMLEQLTTYYGKKIKLGQVQVILGITGDERAKELLKHIITGDIAAGMKTINAVNNDGLDLKQFNRELVSYLRGLLLIKNGCQRDLDLTAEEIAELEELAVKSSLGQILRAVKLFGQLELGFNNYSTLPLELALVDCNLASKEERIGATKYIEPEHVKAPEETTSTATYHPKKQAKTKSEKAEPPPQTLEPAEVIPPEFGDILEQLRLNWKQVIEQAPESRKRTPALAILRSAGVKPIALEGDTIVLAFKYPYHKEKIEETENKKVAAEIISNFIGHACQVRCVHEAEGNHLVQEAQRIGGKIIDVEEK